MIQTVRTPSAVIDAAIAEFGARRVILRAMRAFFAPRPQRLPRAEDLPNTLRRDIGLPPAAPPLTGWEQLR